MLSSNYGNHLPLLIVSFDGSLPVESDQCQTDIGSFSNEIESFQTKRITKKLSLLIRQYDGADHDPGIFDPTTVSARDASPRLKHEQSVVARRSREAQDEKSTKNLLKEYPSAGLELEKTLTADDQTVENKSQIEQNLSEKLTPYIEEANVVISKGDDSDSLNIILTGSIEATNANLVLLGQNIAELMGEAEGIKNIAEVHINIVDREGNDLYRGTYLRNEKGRFTFQSEMRKGKG